MRRSAFVICFVTLSVLFVHPASAAMARASAKAADRVSASFEVSGSNGYALSIYGSGDRVTLSVTSRFGLATYAVPGRVSARAIRARFGKLGRIAVRFHPSGGLTKVIPPRRCAGRPRITRSGTFFGTIRFAGEHGFTRVRAHRAAGRTQIASAWRCKPRHRGGDHCQTKETEAELFTLEAFDRRRGLFFDAAAERLPEEPGYTSFTAVKTERRGRMAIDRFVFASGRESTFTHDALASALIAPPLPFSGSAAFRRNPDGSRTWEGSLRVSFPGAPNLKLTGPGVKTRFSQPVPEPQTFCFGGSSVIVTG